MILWAHMNILFIFNVTTVNFLTQVPSIMFIIKPTIDNFLFVFLWKQINFYCKETQYNQDIGPQISDRAVLEGGLETDQKLEIWTMVQSENKNIIMLWMS